MRSSLKFSSVYMMGGGEGKREGGRERQKGIKKKLEAGDESVQNPRETDSMQTVQIYLQMYAATCRYKYEILTRYHLVQGSTTHIIAPRDSAAGSNTVCRC
jgi:hypothetical protein